MPRHPTKTQYKTISKRLIFLLRSPLSGEFYIGHCQKDSLLPIFRQHCAGDRYQTKVCFATLKNQGLHPCLTILEEVNATPVAAYSHVVAWTKMLTDAGYSGLNTGNIVDYASDLNNKSLSIYNKIKNKNLSLICSCKSCVVANYGRKKCPLYKGDEQ